MREECLFLEKSLERRRPNSQYDSLITAGIGTLLLCIQMPV